MSLQIIETGEVIEPMSRVEAERITARIADKLDGIADNLEQVLDLIGQALTRKAWSALGYASPTAYVSERFSSSLQRLTPAVRGPISGELAAAGFSTRAIAPILGVSREQARVDVREVTSHLSPASPATPDPAPVTDHGLPTSDRIIGMDGKTYRRPAVDRQTGEVLDATPEPARPRRTPLPEQFRNATTDLTRKTEAIARLCADDRFPRNADEVATANRSDLIRAIDALHDVIDLIDNSIKKEDLS